MPFDKKGIFNRNGSLYVHPVHLKRLSYKIDFENLTKIDLNKGRNWFLIFSEDPLIFSLNKTSSFR